MAGSSERLVIPRLLRNSPLSRLMGMTAWLEALSRSSPRKKPLVPESRA